MKPSILALLAAPVVQAAYPGDIVQYWVDQTTILINNTVIGGVQSPPNAWAAAIVQASVYLAATRANGSALASQQLAVSHAAHNALVWVFHGTRNYGATDAALKAVLAPIGVNDTAAADQARRVGRKAALDVVTARTGDRIDDYVEYVYGPVRPGVYQNTPGGSAIPDVPQSVFIRPWAGLGNISRFRAPPPPNVTDKAYDAFLDYVKAQGSLNSTVRKPFDTDTAYFWRESSIAVWNRLAHAIIGRSLATKVVDSARFYAQLNYALANAGIAGWETKFHYNAWRPVTAIQNPTIWLASGRNVSDPSWTPLLRPTPSHPDYVSTHSTFGGAAAAVLRAYVKGDLINATLSSNVTIDNRGVITRTYTNLTVASLENAASRVFGGIHFEFAGSEGIALGDAVAKATLKVFDDNWDEF